MLRVLLVFAVISYVGCQMLCREFSEIKHVPEVMNKLNGPFFAVYSSTKPPISCQNITYTVDANGILTAITEYPGCCMKIHDFDTTDPVIVKYKTTPLTTGCVAPEIVNLTSKFIAIIGSGDSLCLIYTSCYEYQQGIFVSCRKQEVPQGLLDQVISTLENLSTPLSRYLFGIPDLQPLIQTNCVFPENNCPASN